MDECSLSTGFGSFLTLDSPPDAEVQGTGRNANVRREVKRRGKRKPARGVKAVGKVHAQVRGSSLKRRSRVSGHILPKDCKSKQDYKVSLEALLKQFQQLPSGSRYAKHRMNCALKAMQLLDRSEEGDDAELEKLLQELKLS